MKVSEMTNEELAGCIESARLAPAKYVRKDDLNFHGEAIREAAARLRKQDITVAAQKAKGAAEGYAHGCEEVADLRRRLKVAEDALRKLQGRLVASVYDGTIDPHEALKIAEDAIATIRDEGGAK